MKKLQREFTGELHSYKIKFTCHVERSMTLSRVDVTCTLDDIYIECDPGQFDNMEGISAHEESVVVLDHLNLEEESEDIYTEKFVSNCFKFKINEYLLKKPKELKVAVKVRLEQFLATALKVVKIKLPELIDTNTIVNEIDDGDLFLGEVKKNSEREKQICSEND